MCKEKKVIILLCIFLVFIVCFVLVLFIGFKNDSEYELLINSNSVSTDKDDISSDDYENDSIDNIEQELFVENITNEESSDENINNEVVTDIFYNEEDVVKYFEDIELEVKTSTLFKEKFKEYFILIVDFIFYDGEIKGYHFDELSDSAKAKIIAASLKIDNKIEEYVPNYKESITSTSSKVYNNVKDRLVSLYMDISIDICTKNKDECNMVKDIFSEIKEVCKIGWDYIKKLTNKGITNLKDWYEIYSGK